MKHLNILNKTKKILFFSPFSFLLFSLLPLAMQAQAIIDEGTCGRDLTWVLTDDGTLTISGDGEMANYFEQPVAQKKYPDEVPAPWNSHRNKIKTVIISNGVLNIGDRAFYDCPELTSVSIGNSVKTIGVSAFQNCTQLTSVSIGRSVARIGSLAFYNCYNLYEITCKSTHIVGSISPIGDRFYNVPITARVYVPANVLHLHQPAPRSLPGNAPDPNQRYRSPITAQNTVPASDSPSGFTIIGVVFDEED